MPRLSILIPAFNTERFIAKTIDSVLAQTYKDWELIILDDKSTDNTYQVALRYAEKYPDKITLHRNESNLGMMLNWNKGIDLCKNELFVKLDADDIWLPDFLEKSIAIIDKYPDVGLVFTKYINIDEEDHTIPGSEMMLPDFANEKPFSTIPLVQQGHDVMISYPILRQGLSVMRRHIFEEIGKYRYLITPETQASTDTEFYFRVGMHYKLYCINETLYQYRIHNTSISKLDKNNQLANQKIYEIKISILNYYLDHRIITKAQYLRDLDVFRFRYHSFLIQKFMKEKKVFKSLGILIKTFFLSPKRTIAYYSKRFSKS